MRWCVVSFNEEQKCQTFAFEVDRFRNVTFNETYMKVQCVRGRDYHDCMSLIEHNQADVINLEAGLVRYAVDWHMLMPILMERYDTMYDDITKYSAGLQLYSLAVVSGEPDRKPINRLEDLQNASSCHAGAGFGASWNLPIATLIKLGIMNITDCTIQMASVTDFFGPMCAAGALNEAFNPFGLNPTTVCDLCGTTQEEKCTMEDPYAGYYGATRCLAEKGDVAFVTNAALFYDPPCPQPTTGLPDPLGKAQLLCMDGKKTSLSSYESCNWGTIPGNAVVTNSQKNGIQIERYKTFLRRASQFFKFCKVDEFNLFESATHGYRNSRDLMFSDNTKMLIEVPSMEDYFILFKADNNQAGGDQINLFESSEYLSYCPQLPLRWCVTYEAEFRKCTRMKVAFKQRQLKPEVDCIYVDDIPTCMRMIKEGDADVILLDPGEQYIAGRDYDLVPIIAADYGQGDVPSSFFVVGVSQKADPITTLYNLRERRTCHPAVQTAAGFYIPLLTLIGSQVMPLQHCDLPQSLANFINYGCMPGVLNTEYKKNSSNPITLCEGCASQSYRKCERNPWELYFGTSGAFRCLAENAGDIAFVKHFTVRENTDGHNQAEWARNRRSVDYQLSCRDGRRAPVDDWRMCNLAQVPASAIVTSRLKTANQRWQMWQLINHAQLYFAGQASEFRMFESETDYKDLIFEDSTAHLVWIPPEQQTSERYLSSFNFYKMAQEVHRLDCSSASMLLPASSVLLLLVQFFIFY